MKFVNVLIQWSHFATTNLYLVFARNSVLFDRNESQDRVIHKWDGQFQANQPTKSLTELKNPTNTQNALKQPTNTVSGGTVGNGFPMV